MSEILFLLVSGVGCDFCLWLFLDVSVYLFTQPFQSHTLYVTFPKHVKWRLSCTIPDESKRKQGGDTSIAHDAFLSRIPGLILGFRGFKSSSTFRDSCFFLDFGPSYVALFNGLTISDIQILVLHVYCCVLQIM